MKGADADTDTDGDLFLASDEDEDSSSSSSPLPVTPESATSSSKPPASLTGHAAGCGDGGGVGSDGITEREFSCHCCYDVLVDPTTLNCGHSFCRHCLAQWWESSHKTECPECREKWEGFPRVNILLRDAVEKLFPGAVLQRREQIHANPRVSHSVLAFQRHGDEQANRGVAAGGQRRGAGGFFSGVLTALTAVAVMLLVYHWSSGEGVQELLVSKPVSNWSPEDVALWLEHLGPWAALYRDSFDTEQVNGRLLTLLDEEELSRPPYSVLNQAHRRAILEELERVRALGVKPPQNLWEYKAVNGGKSLFLLYALKSSPRLTLVYLYLFDYENTFLPFIHTCCPAHRLNRPLDGRPAKTPEEDPNWKQWSEFLVKYALLPYQLIAEFAWDWLGVHYWTSRFVIVNAMLLSVLEGCAFWRIWSRSEIRTLPKKMWSHFWKMMSQGLAFILLWPMIPQFVCNCLFYWALYFNPIINIDLVVQQLRHPDTQVP
ncbi:bifunctional apoptosis regulator [Clupea harengus]|uniref:Bifunctional apoptosis regulator n=1 Tax=Clupea harengus TaxID=7950 RepID=A0A6P3VQ09_CLUHA|nr:bifunctional apoptosis regulator [Clupea harengus]XP_031418180.1 bifunctional apoptosis regulator [Clupea harengus]XP_031418181.1 bifunctional apoptosis regulator [Clupea harengus]